ncbi:MAG: universal stress protein [Gemmataceae bacterium]|nr:universal stress protein [Gemmataceae bacterium]
MLPIKVILHPTDFSEQANNAFQLACSLARDYRARLILLHVFTPPSTVYGEFGAVPPETGDLMDSYRARLAQVKPAPENIVVERFVIEGHPPTEIVRLADEMEADLIVLGTHGRTGLGRLLMGSVAEVVMRKAPCPVLTVKMPMPHMAEAETPAEPAAVG